MRNRKKWMVMCLIISLAGLAGCGNKGADTGEKAAQESDSEISATEDGEDNSMDVVGQGFRPPEGSHVDKNGHIVDKEGNTFDKDGGWQVPEGGHVDSSGRVYDKDGNLMGGGAKIGSKG